MNTSRGNTIEDNDQYRLFLNTDETVLILKWKYVAGLAVQDFQKGITDFANYCKEYKPKRALIDAAPLDQGSPAVAWLRAQHTGNEMLNYASWWEREIVPMYHDAGIASLAVGTGAPNAPGPLQNVPPGVRFKIGYFPDIETAQQWNDE